MEKIKQFLISEKGKNIFLVLIIILVGTGSFELGKLSSDRSSGIKVTYPETLSEIVPVNGTTNESIAKTNLSGTVINANITQKSTPTAGVSAKSFFASSRGSKYYPSGCSAGKTIKMENRVYFATRVQAEAAGYTLSSSCK